MTHVTKGWNKIAACALFVAVMCLAAASVRSQETVRKVLSSPTPVYPELAKQTHIAGSVKVQVVIGTDGKIKNVKVIGGHPLLVDAVQETLKNWKYAAASTETTTILQFNFHE